MAGNELTAGSTSYAYDLADRLVSASVGNTTLDSECTRPPDRPGWAGVAIWRCPADTETGCDLATWREVVHVRHTDACPCTRRRVCRNPVCHPSVGRDSGHTGRATWLSRSHPVAVRRSPRSSLLVEVPVIIVLAGGTQFISASSPLAPTRSGTATVVWDRKRPRYDAGDPFRVLSALRYQ